MLKIIVRHVHIGGVLDGDVEFANLLMTRDSGCAWRPGVGVPVCVPDLNFADALMLPGSKFLTI